MRKLDDTESAAGTERKLRRRGRWTAQQRRRIVADSLVEGASVRDVARRHGVRPNLLTAWRRREGALHATPPVKFAAVKLSVAPAEGSIEIDLAAGCVRVRGIVDAGMLREVLEAAR